ncbi:MAG: AAA family ATPase [Treponema sp.]|nr:AAA family ATPase [Treponema sp.]
MSESNENARKLANLLLHTHNLILHGAPGTGKTHLAKEIAKEMGAEWEMVQFHPSYDYTDFVEGLRPIKTDDGNQIGFERKDGVFKEFCERALKSFEESPNENNFDDAWNKLIEEVRNNLANNKLTKIGSWEYGLSQTESLKYSSVDSPSKYSFTITRQNIFDTYSGKQARPKGGFQKDMELIVSYMKEHYNLANYKENIGQKKNDKPFLFIIDEINRGEISKIFGELFFSIDPGYRGEKGKISTQYQNLIEPSDVFADGFYVPENVYIIGTMNDIDRSVESMDFAFRRRFTFCEIKANENLGMLDELEEAIREEAKARLLNLNEAISKIEGLSSAYHIGGAYFLKLKELENGFYSLWDYHLKGLLREYLRGMEGADALLETLKSAYENHGLDSELA